MARIENKRIRLENVNNIGYAFSKKGFLYALEEEHDLSESNPYTITVDLEDNYYLEEFIVADIAGSTTAFDITIDYMISDTVSKSIYDGTTEDILVSLKTIIMGSLGHKLKITVDTSGSTETIKAITIINPACNSELVSE